MTVRQSGEEGARGRPLRSCVTPAPPRCNFDQYLEVQHGVSLTCATTVSVWVLCFLLHGTEYGSRSKLQQVRHDGNTITALWDCENVKLDDSYHELLLRLPSVLNNGIPGLYQNRLLPALTASPSPCSNSGRTVFNVSPRVSAALWNVIPSCRHT